MNSEPVTIAFEGKEWVLLAQDVAGVPSLLSTPLSALETLFGAEFARAAKRAREKPAAEVLTVGQALVGTELVVGQISFDGRSAKLNIRTVPDNIVTAAQNLPRSKVIDAAATKVIVGLKLGRN
ncbi:MAG: hypothetical protein ACR2O1_16305 [Boseongicola sp.]